MVSRVGEPMKIGVVAGIVASALFVYLLDPLVSVLGRWMLGLGGTAANWYLDRLFSEIATGSIDYAFVLFYLAVCALLGVPIGVLVGRLASRTGVGEGQRARLLARAIRYTAFAISYAFLACTVLDGVYRLKTISSFRQHVTILRAVADPVDILRLEAAFASMSSRADYAAVEEGLRALAMANQVTLPENKLYPLP